MSMTFIYTSGKYMFPHLWNMAALWSTWKARATETDQARFFLWAFTYV